MNSVNKLYFVLILTIVPFLFSCDEGASEEVVPIAVETQDMNFSIDENPTSNQLIGAVIGTTNRGEVKFVIKEQNPANAFTIDQNTGELFVDDTAIYDFETLTEITGVVTVFNGSVFSNSNVKITINDVLEDIFYGDVILKNQDEINAFALKNYRVITGALEIVQGTNLGTSITDLSKLETLEEVQGHLWVTNNPELKGLNGLHNITKVKECWIFKNANLEDITSLANIVTLESIGVEFNPKITSLECFSNIKELDGACSITENNALSSLKGLNQITTIGGNLTITQNKGLNNIFDLSALTTVEGSLTVSNNPLLTNLNGLSQLKTISGAIFILDNDNLFDINALQTLSSFSGELYLNLNSNLRNVDGLTGLTGIKRLQIVHCDALKNLDGLANLSSVDGTVLIQSNDLLDDFCGLTNLINKGFSGDYSVAGNLFNPTMQNIIDGNCNN